MRQIVAVIIICLFATPFLCSQEKSSEVAQKAAENWLSLTDNNKYGESWDQAASVFKVAVMRDQWQKAIAGARGPLGKVISRKLKSATYTTTLPGMPDGQYVVIQYETSFENKKSAVETITPMMDKDGQWRVSGYFIR